jgi:hypothetical protein
MTVFLAQILAHINILMNWLGSTVLAPIAVLPGWLSNTIISAVVGVLLLIAFKYTSNQKAISRVRDGIKAQLLAMKLFKDNVSAIFRAQGRILVGAFLLLFYALPPVLVMVVPVCLLLGQLGLWYQARPLNVGQDAVVTVQLAGAEDAPWPQISLDSSGAAKVDVGPVKIFSERQVCWKIQAAQNGYNQLNFRVDGQPVDKELAVGQGFMRVSVDRPVLGIADVVMNPAEKPFAQGSPVQSIRIDYPVRLADLGGINWFWLGDYIRKNWWWIYFFIASMVFALIFKPVLKVKL